MYQWLEAASRRLSESVGDEPELYRFGEGEADRLLQMAGVAAHEGGHKTNAPLLSYLVGIAHGRHPGVELADLIDAATAQPAAS
jgi:Domain of unknown function (DUF6457)